MSEVRKRRMMVSLSLIGALLTAVAMWMIATSTSAEAQQENRNTVFGLTAGNRLVSFGGLNPGNFRTDVAITGLDDGERLVGMDMRPATNRLFAVSDDSNLYRINPNNGAATEIELGEESADLEGEVFGVDFNPQADALRIVSDTGQNLRVPFASGPSGRTIIEDTPLVYALGDPNVGPLPASGAGYTNNVPGAASTSLFYIDFRNDVLATVAPGGSANTGPVATVGELGENTTGVVGFDIAPRQGALAALKMPGQRSELFNVDLESGEVESIGTLERNVIDIAIQLTRVAPPEETTDGEPTITILND